MEKLKKTVIQYIYKYTNGIIDENGYKYSYGEFSEDPNLIKHAIVYNPDETINYTLDFEFDQTNKQKLLFCYNSDKTLRYKLENLINKNGKLTDCTYYRADNSIILHFEIFEDKYSETYYNPDKTINSNATVDFDQQNDIIEFIDDDTKIIKAVKYTAIKYDKNGKEVEVKSEFDHWTIKREDSKSEIKVIKNNGEMDYIKTTIIEYF